MKSRISHTRKCVQIIWGILTNAYLPGFLKGTIYQGPLKNLCVPGINCYSCPGALGSCPIGAMQSLFDGRKRRFAFSVAGYLAALGLLVGRFICGWLCLFGLIQELLYKIPVPKLRLPGKLDRALRYLKYAVLLILVFGLPFFWRNELGIGEPFFCKYLCPVGTLEGGVPLVLLRRELRAAVGFLFHWKLVLLAITLLASMTIHRPFCKYLCPLGAFYSLFQKISLLRMKLDRDKCISCGKCEAVCPMDVCVTKDPNSAECIRCAACIRSCTAGALSFTGGRWTLKDPSAGVKKKKQL